MPIELEAIIKSADTFVAQGLWQKAADAYARLARLCPRQPGIHHVHGLALMEQQQWQAALHAIDRAICLDPGNAAYYRSRGDASMSSGNLQQAVEAYLKALTLKPDDTSAMINLGNALHAQDCLEQALQWYRKAVNLDPGNVMALNNIGKTLYDQGHMDQCLPWYEKALCIDPAYGEARFNRSVVLLSQGDYMRGWKEYDWRFRRKSARRVYPHRLQGRRWNGSSYSGKRLFVHCEQGMGDVIQFCRFLPQVKALGGTLIVEVHAPLIPLMRMIRGIDQVIPFDAHHYPPVEFDLYAPLLSLPGLFGTSLDDIAGQTPYLFADPRKAGLWRPKVEKTKGLRIGIVWSGSATDPRRACPVEQLAPLIAIPDTHFFILQKDLSKTSLQRFREYGNVTHWGDQLDDFGDTAAAISGLDLIISVDTAVAHLAGAMGKRVWILLPAVADWRWLLNRQDSPWYPSARLFRQKAVGDWPALIRNVAAQLNALVAVHLTFNRGCTCHEANLLDDAIGAYVQTIAMAPDLEPAYRNLALAYFQKGDLQKATDCYKKALEIKPTSPEVLTNLGAVYLQMQQPSRAKICCAKALEIDPSCVAANYNLGNIYLDLGNLESAADQYRRTLDIDPEHISALCNLGRTFHRLGRLEEALALYDRGLKRDPDHPEIRFNRAVTLLLQGRWADGWPEYEWRFKCHNRRKIYPHRLSGDRWQGQPYAGRTLLVHSEQGLGDAMQFVRFLPFVKQLGGRVLLETHKSLLPLFNKLQGVDALIELSGLHPPTQDYDLYIPLCSLPGLFKMTPNSMPRFKPYIVADEDRYRQWRARLPRKGINVGLVWHGSDTYPERSCALRQLANLHQVEGINWIGLQKGKGTGQIDDPELPAGFNVLNWGPDFKDFADTAAAVAALDLIISIDTSVAHLAGAMGKPIWILLPKVPDWRWQLVSIDTPWYTTMRLFRQRQSGDWLSVTRQVSAMLRRHRFDR